MSGPEQRHGAAVQDRVTSPLGKMDAGELPKGAQQAGGSPTRTAILGLFGMAGVGVVGMAAAAGGLIVDPLVLAAGMTAALAVGGIVLARLIGAAKGRSEHGTSILAEAFQASA